MSGTVVERPKFLTVMGEGTKWTLFSEPKNKKCELSALDSQIKLSLIVGNLKQKTKKKAE